MRILILNSEYPPIGGGAGNANANIACCLAAQGHEVAVVTALYKGLPRQEKRDNLIIYRIPTLRRYLDRSSAIEQMAFIFSASFWTAGLILRFKPDIILAFFGMPSGAVAYFIEKIFHIRYVVSLRGGDVPGFRPYDFRIYHTLIAPFLRIVWRDASAIVANSIGLRDLALAFDSHFKIPIIPNGVDLDLFQAGERAQSVPCLLSVGRVVHQKGFDLAVRALAGLKDLEWEWRIAGDGPQMDALKALAGEYGISERVIFLGWKSRDELIQQYQHANLFLFPSRHEGMPNAVLEAMASGLPIVASRIAGNEELVIDGETGLLFPSEDVHSLRVALKKLLNDASLRKQMGAASRQRVEEKYSWESAARQYALLFEDISKFRL